MSEPQAAAARFSGRTAWARNLETPLRAFLRTESGSAAFLLAATLAALAWANVDAGSYESVWHTTLAIRLGGSGVSLDLVQWVNAGLMTFKALPDLTADDWRRVLGVDLLGAFFFIKQAFARMKANSAMSPARNRRLRDWLTGGQVAVSFVLLIAASMMVRSAFHALTMDTGYDTKHVIDLTLQFPEGAGYDLAHRNALLGHIVERVKETPGVVEIATGRPPDGGGLRGASSLA